MSLNVPAAEWRARTLRAWQLAILRFAVTLDPADRLAVMSVANEIDRPGPPHDGEPDFSFFRRTSAELCATMLRPNELTPAILRQYLSWIDDDRLKHVFAAAIEVDQSKLPLADQPFKPDNALWKGLSSNGTQAPPADTRSRKFFSRHFGPGPRM